MTKYATDGLRSLGKGAGVDPGDAQRDGHGWKNSLWLGLKVE